MRIADLPHPDTAATRAAEEVLDRYAAPALAHHARRSWLWAAAIGDRLGLPYDAELLRVGALLHDLGLEEPFDSHRMSFEQAGGEVAWVFAAGAGWPAGRRDRLAAVIVAHMAASTDPEREPEGHLLRLSTGLDIAGSGYRELDPELRAEVLAALPRLDLADRFGACFTDQARRKPDSSAAASVRRGVLPALAANPLEG
ncbi:MAG: hypothetical protein AVDCRST_MAG41-171 [uncultured Corynebacteriales bacterium]|uniref:HD domain-containing protein n=1 Tax=uncultured Mycobacteriales bacterium TaxID=581187 RepID=A0A6J4H5N5_9ACTN|nr:MAG: hypothetical protein AVDCRST_MAG41-171 [uncultured Corynebacteriales bacterium]